MCTTDGVDLDNIVQRWCLFRWRETIFAEGKFDVL